MFLFGGYNIKTEHNLKNIPKYDKNNLTNNFVENSQTHVF